MKFLNSTFLTIVYLPYCITNIVELITLIETTS